MAGEKRLVFSILKFLEDQRTSSQLDEEAKESLEVAVQCLEQVYKLNTTEGEHVMKYSVAAKLVDIFTAKTGSTESSSSFHEASPEQKEQAERLKNKGNDFMKLEKFPDAVENYSQAIKLDSSNAVYFCNRAAAYSKLNNHKLAIDDCNSALAIDPSYSKAYGRMGIAFTALENHESAFECYQKALELDPDNQSYKNNFEVAEQKLKERAAQGAFNLGPAGNIGSLGGLGNMDFASALRDPNIMNLASTFMSNPQIQQIISNVVGGSNPGSGGLTNLLQASQQITSQMQQANPDLLQQLREQRGGHGQAGNNNDQNNDQDPKPHGE